MASRENGTGCSVVGGAGVWKCGIIGNLWLQPHPIPTNSEKVTMDYTHVLRQVYLKLCSDLVKSLQDLECIHAHTACFCIHTLNMNIYIYKNKYILEREREKKRDKIYHMCIGRYMIYYMANMSLMPSFWLSIHSGRPRSKSGRN